MRKGDIDSQALATLHAGLSHAGYRRAMAEIFRRSGLSVPGLEARFLFEAAINPPGTAGLPVDETQNQKLHAMVLRRLAGEPVDRIIGNAEFWSRRFDLNDGTLSPRPDTETLIEASLAVMAASGIRNPRILDLGTGTGAILITLLAECITASGTGTDTSGQALAMARGNSVLHGVAARASFRQGSWTGGLEGPFDLIVSNPPYIPTGEIDGLDREVRLHDPLPALDGGLDGLQAYREIAAGLARLLATGGHVVFEIGAGQEADVTAIMAGARFVPAGQRRDLGGHVRALVFVPADRCPA
jgi:release factor glutamine methyltransferase